MGKRIPGIPTLYKGIRFRSRLEAKWASFFDLLGWRWEYEPFDLNGWIPDFLLIGEGLVDGALHDDSLIEVKPIRGFSQEVADKIAKAVHDTKWRDDGLFILGCSVNDTSSCGWYGLDMAAAGVSAKDSLETFCEKNPGYIEEHEYLRPILEIDPDETKWEWQPVGVSSEGLEFEWGPCLVSRREASTNDVLRAWAEAGNMTQWKGREAA